MTTLPTLWRWYEDGGIEHVAAYLTTLDISMFDTKAPPPKTAAFWEMVSAGRAPEEDELADVLDALNNPEIVTLEKVVAEATGEFAEWLRERRNRRLIPHRMEACGYRAVRNPDAQDGMWKLGGRRIVIYAKSSLAREQQVARAKELTSLRPPTLFRD